MVGSDMTPKTISVDNLKSNFDEILRRVKIGESFTITIGEEPVADISPSSNTDRSITQMAIDNIMAARKQFVSDKCLARYRVEGRSSGLD